MIEDISNRKVLNFTGLYKTIFGELKYSPRKYVEQVKNHPIAVIMVKSSNSQEFYDSLKELVRYCDNNVCIKNLEVADIPNKEDFFKGEEIISKFIAGINPEWSQMQKAAYVHHHVAKIISYIPDEIFSSDYYKLNVNNYLKITWNALSNGMSVCNGISNLTMSILGRLGIESEELHGRMHSFLLVKTDEGNIITDPTWDLARNLYDAKPYYFGRSYEDIRKNDGFENAHLLDNPPENLRVLSEQELRELYHSIGLTGEDRRFPCHIAEIMQQIKQMQDMNKKQKTEEFFKLYMERYREESTHLCESIKMLVQCLHGIGIDRINMRCVYTKDDVDCKNPIMVFHSGEDELADSVYVFPKRENEDLKTIDINEFDKKYKIHSNDKRAPFWKAYLTKDIQSREESEKEK